MYHYYNNNIYTIRLDEQIALDEINNIVLRLFLQAFFFNFSENISSKGGLLMIKK